MKIKKSTLVRIIKEANQDKLAKQEIKKYFPNSKIEWAETYFDDGSFEVIIHYGNSAITFKFHSDKKLWSPQALSFGPSFEIVFSKKWYKNFEGALRSIGDLY